MSGHSTWPEWVYVGVVIALLCYVGAEAWNIERIVEHVPEDAEIIKVTGQQWIWTFEHEDGTKEMEKSYKNGRLDGLWRWWNETGELMKSGTYVNGMKQGMWNYYYDKGQKYFEDIERQIREGGGHWQWVDGSYGIDEETGKGGERGQKPFVTTAKKWRPRAERTI